MKDSCIRGSHRRAYVDSGGLKMHELGITVFTARQHPDQSGPRRNGTRYVLVQLCVASQLIVAFVLQ